MHVSLPLPLAALVFAAAFDASAARAAEPPLPDLTRRAEAKAHYAQGAAAYQAGRYHQAVEQFLTADRIAPSAALSFNTARAYEKLGDSARALEFYRDYLRRGATPDLDGKDIEAKVRKRVAELESALAARGLQQLTVLSEPSGAEIRVDGKVVGTTPKTVELAPGSHVLAVEKDGFVESIRDVDLPREHALDVSVTLASAPPPAPSRSAGAAATSVEPERERASRTSVPRPGPWVTMGLGGAALVGAGVFEVMRRSAESDAQSTPQANYSEYEDRYDRAQTYQTTARVLAGAGGALVLIGGVWALLDGREEKRERPKTALACGKSSCFGSVRVAF